MTALSANYARPSRNLGAKRPYPVNAASVIYAGALVMIDADGFARPAAALASNGGCVGVATEKVTGGAADGDKWVEVQEGEFLFAGDTLAQTALVAGIVYADDDNTVDETQATNCPKAGIVTQYNSASEAWVAVSATNRLL